MQIGAFNTLSDYLRWRSRSERVVFPCITTSGTNSRLAAGHLPLGHDIAATNSSGTVAIASSRFAGHFTLAKAVLPNHPQSLMRSLRLIRLSMSSASSSHNETPNQALERTAARRTFTFQMVKTVSVQVTLALDGGRSASSR